MLWSLGLQRVRHDWATELNWYHWTLYKSLNILSYISWRSPNYCITFCSGTSILVFNSMIWKMKTVSVTSYWVFALNWHFYHSHFILSIQQPFIWAMFCDYPHSTDTWRLREAQPPAQGHILNLREESRFQPVWPPVPPSWPAQLPNGKFYPSWPNPFRSHFLPVTTSLWELKGLRTASEESVCCQSTLSLCASLQFPGRGSVWGSSDLVTSWTPRGWEWSCSCPCHYPLRLEMCLHYNMNNHIGNDIDVTKNFRIFCQSPASFIVLMAVSNT